MSQLTKLKVVKKKELNYTEKVCDLTVANVHHYIDENNIIHHNSGLYYSASTIAFLSKAKLKEGEMDDLDLGQSGLVVTAKMVKNRMAKPKKVKFEISFVSGCNPFVGLDYWCSGDNFEQVGVAKGKMVGDVFVAGGNRWYVRHLGKHIPKDQLFSATVFNKEVLDGLRPIIKEYFRYRSITEINEIEAKMLEAKGEIEEDEMYADDINVSNLFDSDED